MAIIGELGKKYPCSSEGDAIDLNDDQAKMYPGEIVEAVYEVDGTLNRQTAQDIIVNTLKMKEEYPLFVLHYIKCETRSVTVQFSVAPHGATLSGASGSISEGEDGARIAVDPISAIILISVLAFLYGILSFILPVAIKNGWILRLRPRTGSASAVARNQETDAPLGNVTISVSGQSGMTGPEGQTVVFEDLIVGEHLFIGGAVEGFQPPDAVTARIIEASMTPVTIWYKPEGYVEPDYGWLALATHPVEGAIYVLGLNEGKPVGTGYAHIEVPKGEYQVYFGPVEGWLTPPQVPLKVAGGKPTSWVAEYTKPEDRWWEKYIKYALIGGGAIIGTAILLPEIVRQVSRRGTQS